MKANIEVRYEDKDDLTGILHDAADWIERGVTYIDFQEGDVGATVDLNPNPEHTSTNQRQEQVDETAMLVDDAILSMLYELVDEMESMVSDFLTPKSHYRLINMVKDKIEFVEGNPSCGQ